MIRPVDVLGEDFEARVARVCDLIEQGIRDNADEIRARGAVAFLWPADGEVPFTIVWQAAQDVCLAHGWAIRPWTKAGSDVWQIDVEATPPKVERLFLAPLAAAEANP